MAKQFLFNFEPDSQQLILETLEKITSRRNRIFFVDGI
jgi:hypothetical protein